VLVGAQVTFTGSARDDDTGETNKLQFFWDFGDGESTPNPNYQQKHVYRTDGTFEIIMTVTDGFLESQTRATVNVEEMDIPLISYPSNGSQVSGVISISGRIREVRGFEVDKVEVKVGSGEWKLADGTTQWAYALNTALYKNGEIDIYVRYTVNDATPIQTTTMITVSVLNEGEGNPEWMVPAIAGGVIGLLVLIILVVLGRKRSRGWELVAPPGPGPGMPPRIPPTVAAGGLPAPAAKPSLPPTGAQPPKAQEPKQAEPPAPSTEEKGPRMIRIKCPACSKVFKIADNGQRPLHITCKHCGALGTIDKVPGDDEKKEEEQESPPEPEEEPVEPVPIVCPVCGGLFELDEFTESAKCPMCGAEGELDEGTLSELRERFGIPEPEEMTLRCPSCTGTFKVKENEGPIICPYCGAKGKASA
jgi:DNA-directed RNA polymerase subunit RPC12/RpoP